MESLVFAANAVLPIIIMVALGWFLKKAGIVGKDFVKVGNRLVFKIFLPVMLFTNVYKIENLLHIFAYFIAIFRKIIKKVLYLIYKSIANQEKNG